MKAYAVVSKVNGKWDYMVKASLWTLAIYDDRELAEEKVGFAPQIRKAVEIELPEIEQD